MRLHSETPWILAVAINISDKCFNVVKISRPKPAIKMQSNRGYELPLVNILKNTMVTSSVPDREGKSQRVIDGPVTSITSAPAHAASSDWICIYQALAKETFAFARSDVLIFRLVERHVHLNFTAVSLHPSGTFRDGHIHQTQTIPPL